MGVEHGVGRLSLAEKYMLHEVVFVRRIVEGLADAHVGERCTFEIDVHPVRAGTGDCLGCHPLAARQALHDLRIVEERQVDIAPFEGDLRRRIFLDNPEQNPLDLGDRFIVIPVCRYQNPLARNPALKDVRARPDHV